MSVNVLGSLSGGVSPAGDRGKVGNAQGWFAAGGELGRHAFARNGLRRNRRGSAERSCGRIGFQFDQKWFSWGEIGFICVGFWRFCAAPGEGWEEKTPRFSASAGHATPQCARGLRQISIASRGGARLGPAPVGGLRHRPRSLSNGAGNAIPVWHCSRHQAKRETQGRPASLGLSQVSTANIPRVRGLLRSAMFHSS